MKVYIGTSGWQYYHWKIKFYPENLQSKDFLSFYSKHFNTVEINTSFYHFTKISTFEKWKEIVKESKYFLFAIKLHRLFTHFRKLKLNKDDKKILKETLNSYKVLGSHLGPILIQLPPSLKKDTKLLKNFLSEIKKISNIKLAIEFRHKSWLDKEVYKLLKKLNVAFCISDSPRWPTDFVKTTDFIYVRFHGKPKLFASKYSEEELKYFANKLRKLKPKILFIYFNNDFEGYAVENALFMKKLFN